MFEELHTALAEYNMWRHPGLDPLEEGEPYALLPSSASTDVKLHWPLTLPAKIAAKRLRDVLSLGAYPSLGRQSPFFAATSGQELSSACSPPRPVVK
jgi:hypothetical protein